MTNQFTNFETSVNDFKTDEFKWKSLYRIGGTAAFIMVLITLCQFIAFSFAPPPLNGTTSEWFDLFNRSAFLGLLSFESLLIIYSLLSVFVSLAVPTQKFIQPDIEF